MNLQQRIDLMVELGEFLKKNSEDWLHAKMEAYQKNPWFIPDFIDTAVKNIVDNFLQKDLLENWALHYHLDDNISPKNVGIVMAGNIPLVGFHDFLAVFISGHKQTIKLSSKDDVLLKFIIQKLQGFNKEIKEYISIAPMLKGCDAYIATGSNNTARYFEQYFSKYPHIIRSNKTSVAVVTGQETPGDLEKLSDDIHLFFGLGCRNITKIYFPKNYDFVPLLKAFDKYKHFADNHKYMNNFDYQLSILLLNNKYYITNGSTLLVENEALFSAISIVNYEYYDEKAILLEKLKSLNEIQCIEAKDCIPFGQAQKPSLFSYADGVDVMQFLLAL